MTAKLSFLQWYVHDSILLYDFGGKGRDLLVYLMDFFFHQGWSAYCRTSFISNVRRNLYLWYSKYMAQNEVGDGKETLESVWLFTIFDFQLKIVREALLWRNTDYGSVEDNIPRSSKSKLFAVNLNGKFPRKTEWKTDQRSTKICFCCLLTNHKLTSFVQALGS